MSERDGFQPGVPSWVDVLGPDPRRLLDFYGPLFGWEFDGPGEMPGEPPGEYFVAQLRGRAVAGVGSLPSDGAAPGWSTYIEVESVERTIEAVQRAGGTVAVDPFDAPPAGRIAVVSDPAGAAFCIWEPAARSGAEVVNEPSAWSMSALNTGDFGAAAEFYGAVFGWQLDTFQMGDLEVGLLRLPGFVGGEPEQPVPRDLVATMARLEQGAQPHWGVHFWVGDLDRVTATAAERGGSVIVPPHELPAFREAVLADPNGAAFGVSQLVAAP
jgi:predicted enzyme related to lactoylglutathione lyase